MFGCLEISTLSKENKKLNENFRTLAVNVCGGRLSTELKGRISGV